MNWKYIFIFISGIIFYDGINHLILAVSGSPFSVHGVRIGLTGNWLVFTFDIILAIILIYFSVFRNKKTKSRK